MRNSERRTILGRPVSGWRPRSLLIVAIVLVMAPGSAFAQVTERPQDLQATSLSFGLDAEVGLLSFENETGDGERFLSTTLAPSFERGFWSGGLRLRYRWNENGAREEDYDETADFIAIIRYIQYSEKYEPGYYGRLGDIDRADLGYGQFVNRYRNTLSLDHPETGFLLDHVGENFLFEGMISDVTDARVYGIRAAYKPYLRDSSIVHRKISFGMTLAGDLSDAARLENEYKNGLPFIQGDVPVGADTIGVGGAVMGSPLTLLGVDASMPVNTSKVDDLNVYAELGHILGFGVGLGVGAEFEHQFEKVQVKGWFVQRLSGQEYVPSYLNSNYERERLRSTVVTLADTSEVEAVNSKRNRLFAEKKIDLGNFVAMEFRINRYYRIRWSLEHSWTRENQGWFQLDLRMTDPAKPVRLRYVFDRANMNGPGDILKFSSEDTLHRLEVQYLVLKYIYLGLRYRQSFETLENLGREVGQKKSARIEPLILISL